MLGFCKQLVDGGLRFAEFRLDKVGVHGLRIWHAGLSVKGLGLGFRVWGLGFRAWGLGLGA